MDHLVEVLVPTKPVLNRASQSLSQENLQTSVAPPFQRFSQVGTPDGESVISS